MNRIVFFRVKEFFLIFSFLLCFNNLCCEELPPVEPLGSESSDLISSTPEGGIDPKPVEIASEPDISEETQTNGFPVTPDLRGSQPDLPPEPETSKSIIGKEMGDGTAQGAIAWAMDQFPEGKGEGKNVDEGKRSKDGKDVWDYYCLGFANAAYGKTIPELKAPSAKDSYSLFKDAGKISTTTQEIPLGAVVFSSASEWGHICLATGDTENDDPIVITTGFKRWPGLHRVPLSEMMAKAGGKYLGWASIP